MVLVSSTDEIMQVVNQSKDDSVHLHQFDKGSSFSGKELVKVHVENLCKCGQHNSCLVISKSLKILLVLVLEIFVGLEQEVWKTQEVNQE